MNIKYIPNILSVFRMIFSLFLISLHPFKLPFIILYSLLGLSDLLDGFLARKFNCTSKLGAKLDSYADFIFFFMILFIFIYYYTDLFLLVLPITIAIMGIRLFNMLFSFIKYKQMVMVHTLGNKLSGLLVFSLLIVLSFSTNVILLYVVLSISALAALEELFITFTQKEPDFNKKSIFIR